MDGTDNGIESKDRYREYWAYIRHIENLRFTMGGLVVTVTGAVLGAFAFSHLRPSHRALPWALGFLSLFLGVAASFLVCHNKSYKHYFDKLNDMEEDGKLPNFGKGGPFAVLLVLMSLPQLVIIGWAPAFHLYRAWWLVTVGALALVAPWFLHLSETLCQPRNRGA
jgi:hypothetical protein